MSKTRMHLYVSLIGLAWSAGASAGAGPVAAGQFEKNNFPCFAEVCIGDRAEDLASLPLTPSNEQAKRGVSPYRNPPSPQAFAAIYGFTEASFARGPYIGFASPELIASAARFQQICPSSLNGIGVVDRDRILYLDGEYTTDTGNRTLVELRLFPDPSDPQMRARWMVTRLQRTIPATDAGEANRIKQAAEARYGAFLTSTAREKVAPWERPIASVYVENDAQLAVVVQMIMASPTLNFPQKMWKRLADHPRCTVSTTRSID